MSITCRSSPQHAKRKEFKNTAENETGIKVTSVSVLYSPEKGKVLDKNSGTNLRLGVEYLTDRSFEAVKLSQGSN